MIADELEGLAPEDRLLRIEERALEIRGAAADPERANAAHVLAFERAGQDAGFRRELREVLDRSELPFRNLEAVRMHLAKDSESARIWSWPASRSMWPIRQAPATR